MAANGAFTNMKVPELRKFLKERDIHISVHGKSRQGVELLELCKNAAEIVGPKLEKETVQRDELINSEITFAGGKLLPSRLFTDGHADDLKYHGIIDDGISLAKVGNAVKNFIDSSFFSTSSMKSFRFNTGLLLNSFRIALLAALFSYHPLVEGQCLFDKKQSL